MNHQHHTNLRLGHPRAGRPQFRTRRSVTLMLPFLLVGAMSLAACGDDTDGVAEAADRPATTETTHASHAPDTTVTVAEPVPADTAAPAVTTAPPTTAPAATPTTGAAVEPGVVTITATDYEFVDVPATVPVGSKLAIKNIAPGELHEIVAFRVPDAETRPVAELMMLPPDQLGAALGGAPRVVMLQPPGSDETINAVGDGTLGEPGRYVIFCGIPVGADPMEYLEAAAASHGAPPQGVAGGPPHFVAGMFAEFVVE